MGEVGADEFPRDGKDKGGWDEVGRFQRWVVEEIRERQAGDGIHKRRHRLLYSIAREINPFEEVSDLVSTDAEGDLKHLRIRDFLTHGCVKTRAALLNHSKVKSRCIGDGLKMVGRAVEIGIVFGDGGNSIESDRLGKSRTEVRIGCATVANEPTGVDVEMHEVG